MGGISRRTLLGKVALLGLTGQAGARAEGSPRRKLKVVVAGGHPGDPEYGCGGTIARFVEAGHEAVLLYLNRGDWGFLDKPSEAANVDRAVEANEACRILGARALFASQRNGKAVVDHGHADEFQKLLETEKPDVLFTQWPIDNHADHRAAFALIYEAWLKMDRKAVLYFYEVSSGEDTLMFSPTQYVDITATQARKRKACFAHASQSPDRYYEVQLQTTAFRGLEGGCRYAEAYVRHVSCREDLLPGAGV